MKKIFSILMFAGIFYSSLSFAALSSAMFSAKLVSFNKKTAVVEIGTTKISVPRSSLNQKKMVSGETTIVSLSGAELADFLRRFTSAPTL